MGTRSATSTAGRWVARTAATVAVLLASFVGMASPAQAHAVLVRTAPVAGFSVAGPVSRVRLTFSEAVSANPDAVRVSGPTPGLRSVVVPADGARSLLVATGLLRNGVYLVRWQVSADDGDLVDGSDSFGVGIGVGSGALSATTGDGSPSGSLIATAALRWVLFAALAVSLGGLVGHGLAERLPSVAASESAP